LNSCATTRPSTLSFKPEKATGIPITTPSNGFYFTLDNMVDHTGLTPITNGPNTCSTEASRTTSKFRSLEHNYPYCINIIKHVVHKDLCYLSRIWIIPYWLRQEKDKLTFVIFPQIIMKFFCIKDTLINYAWDKTMHGIYFFCYYFKCSFSTSNYFIFRASCICV
jgi:hypothetical protein